MSHPRPKRPPQARAPGWRCALPYGALLAFVLTIACPGGPTDLSPDGRLPADARVGPDAEPSADGGLDAEVPPACPTLLDASSLGQVATSLATEISGLAASRSQPGVLWVHNDSGDAARIYALDLGGALLGAYTLTGAYHWDYEDLAADTSHLYVADIGDNYAIRPYVTVYRVPEPSVDLAQRDVSLEAEGIEALDLSYPDFPHDAETLLVDPTRGDLYLVTKEADGDDPQLFRAAAPLTVGERRTLESLGSLPIGEDRGGGFGPITAGDVAPDGRRVVLRSADRAFLWPIAAGETYAATFGGGPCVFALPAEPQGEALGFDAAGAGLLTLSEGSAATLHYLRIE